MTLLNAASDLGLRYLQRMQQHFDAMHPETNKLCKTFASRRSMVRARADPEGFLRSYCIYSHIRTDSPEQTV